jgi:hypothetical protein
MELLRKERPLAQEARPPFVQQTDVPGGPKAIETERPDTRSILKKLKGVQRDSAKKYRQKSGE